MYLSKYASTSETTNLARVARMILGPCTDVLRAVLTNEMSPSALSHNVKTFIANYPKYKKCSISKEQENLIHGKIYKNFDISLLYIILRNICQVPDHKEGWGNVPLPTDRSVSANIERIRLIRNEYGHSSEFSVSDTEFKRRWQDILKIVKELESCLSSSTKIQNDVIFISTCSMDPEQESKYIKQLLDLDKKIQHISEETNRIKKICVPENLKVIYEREILKWKEDDAMFVETHNFAAMFDQVKEQTYVMFVGVPGCGKTATARHIALILQTEGYQILPIKDIKDIETYCDPHLPQVFVIDDVIGVFGLDMAELNLLRKYQDRLKCPTMPKTKTLMTCREVVYRNEAFSNTSVFAQDKHVINLSSSANVLTDTDKCKLLAKYNLNVYQFQVRILPKTSNMFPLLCKLFSKKEEYKVHGYMFFLTPIPCILEAMNEMKTNNRIQYASLVLLMANQNKLSEEDLDDVQCSTNVFTEIKNKVLQKCKVNSRTDSFEFTDALAEMEGTYTKKSGNMFTFEHDYMLEIIAYHFGSQCPEIILQIMKSDYISYYIELDTRISRTIEKRKESEDVAVEIVQHSETKIKQDDIFNLCITLTEKQYPILLERLLKDIKNGDYYNVLRSKVLKHSSVLRQFIGIMGSFINLIKRDRTPLTVACHLGDLNIVEELIKAGADVNLRDNTHRRTTRWRS